MNIKLTKHNYCFNVIYKTLFLLICENTPILVPLWKGNLYKIGEPCTDCESGNFMCNSVLCGRLDVHCAYTIKPMST